MASASGNFPVQTNVNDTVSTIATTYDDETSADDIFDGTDGTDATDENSSESVRIDIFCFYLFHKQFHFTAK